MRVKVAAIELFKAGSEITINNGGFKAMVHAPMFPMIPLLSAIFVATHELEFRAGYFRIESTPAYNINVRIRNIRFLRVRSNS